MRTRALIVDDSDLDRSTLVQGVLLAYPDAEITEAPCGADAVEMIRGEAFNLLVTDLVLPGPVDGLKVLAHAKDVLPRIGVVVATGEKSTQPDVRKARALGASCLLFKPVKPEVVSRACRDVMRYRSVREKGREALAQTVMSNPEWEDIKEIVGDSDLVKSIKADIYHFARMDSYPVLITGETGTGKELVARALHRFSPRAKGPFLPLNVALIERDRFETELFGHTRGAFTGAESENPGAVGRADKGILFLDEIETLSLNLQAKLLRFVESREFTRMGEKGVTRYANVRVLLATNRDLDEMVLEGTFREDLYFRINMSPISLPPLRNRGSDIGRLVKHFVEVLSREQGVEVSRIEEGVYEAAAKHSWPGNVRQLRTTVLRSLRDLTKRHGVAGILKAEVFISNMFASQPVLASRDSALASPEVEARIDRAADDAVAMHELAEMWESGRPMPEILGRIKRHRATIYTWLRRLAAEGKISSYPRRGMGSDALRDSRQ